MSIRNAIQTLLNGRLLAGIRPRAVFLGVFWDFSLTLLFGVLLTALADGEAGLAEPSTAFLLVSLVVGTGCTVIGSLIAAARAGTAPMKNGVAVGVVGLILGLILILSAPGGETPVWLDVVGCLLVLPAAALGGRLAPAGEAD